MLCKGALRDDRLGTMKATSDFDLAIGDAVRVKGCDVPMIVHGTSSDRSIVECVWYDDDGALRRSEINADSLERVEP